MPVQYLGHSKNLSGVEQTLEEHTAGVRRIILETLLICGITDPFILWLADVAASGHDIGKANLAVLSYLTDNKLWAPHEIHSAKALWDTYSGTWNKIALRLATYLIRCHHRGSRFSLIDVERQMIAATDQLLKIFPNDPSIRKVWGDTKISEQLLKESVEWSKTLSPFPNPPPMPKNISYAQIRLVQGALNKGDCQDTAAHYGENPPEPFARDALTSAAPWLNAFLEGKNQTYTDPLQQAVKEARDALVLESQTIPVGDTQFLLVVAATGLGKTIISLILALRLAAQRIVVAAPYLSITTQLSQDYLQGWAQTHQLDVLEHLSTPSEEYLQEEDQRFKLKDEYTGWAAGRSALADWNAPLVLTSIQRLSMVLVGHKNTDTRRFLSLMDPNTVLIVDEIHTIPPKNLYLYLKQLSQVRCKVILMSATADVADMVMKAVKVPYTRIGVNLRKIPDRRVYRIRRFPDDQLPDISCEHQVLSIYNTVQLAQKAYLADTGPEDSRFFLAGLSAMCKEHREQVLRPIYARLAEDLPVRVYSTQVIEAGVDISFPLIYRQIAPHPNTVQTGGRCNRHGEMGIGGGVVVIWFWSNLNDSKAFPASEDYQEQAYQLAALLMTKGDPDKGFELSEEAYNGLNAQLPVLLDFPREMAEMDKYLREPAFQELRKHLHIEDDGSVQVLVNFQNAVRLAKDERLNRRHFPQYCISLPESLVEKCTYVDLIQFPWAPRRVPVHVLKYPGLYDKDLGFLLGSTA